MRQCARVLVSVCVLLFEQAAPAQTLEEPPREYATATFPQGEVVYSVPTPGPNAWEIRDLALDESPVAWVEAWWATLPDPVAAAYLDLTTIDVRAYSPTFARLGPLFDDNPHFPFHWNTGATSYVLERIVVGDGTPNGPPSPNYYLDQDQDSDAFEYGKRRIDFFEALGLPPQFLVYLYMYETPPLEMMKPARHYTGEPIADLDEQAYRVEVALPAGDHEIHDPMKVWVSTVFGDALGRAGFLALVDGAFAEEPSVRVEYEAILDGEPPPAVHVRGWYIDAVVEDDEDPLGLVVMSVGRGGEVQAENADWYRLQAAKLARAGFDVWLPDRRAHGTSDGRSSSEGYREVADLLETLDRFETGDGVRVLDADGNHLTPDQIADRLLPAGHTARSVPLLLWGRSQGSSVVQQAMALHVLAKAGMADPSGVEATAFELAYGEGTYPEAVDPIEVASAMAWHADFNIKGVLTVDGFSAGMQSGGHPLLARVGAHMAEAPRYIPGATPGIGFWATWWHYRTADLWPAHFQAGGTVDSPPQSLVEMYNRERGLKEIVLVDGDHFTITRGDSKVREHVFDRAASFARRAVLYGNPHLDDTRQTTLEDELFEVVRTRPRLAEDP